jgi:hypothetical protein
MVLMIPQAGDAFELFETLRHLSGYGYQLNWSAPRIVPAVVAP